MTFERRLRAGLISLAAAALMAPAATAAPITYIVNGLAADITVSRNGIGIGGSVSSIPIVGQQFVFDGATPALVSFAIEVAGDFSNRIQLSVPIDIGFGAVDEIVVSTAVLTSVATASYPAIGGGGIFSFNGVSGGGGVGNATADLLLSNGGGPAIPVNAFVTQAGSVSGTVFADAGAIEAAILGFTLFEFTALDGSHIVAKADLLVTGAAVPEPNVALLYGVAVLICGARVRSQRSV